MKCLVTKLMGIVNNDNLPILGAADFLSSGNVVREISVGYNSPSRVSIVGDGNFLDENDDPLPNKYVDIPGTGSVRLKLSPDSFKLRFHNLASLNRIDGITTLQKGGSDYILNIEDVSELKNAGINGYYNFKGCIVKGDIGPLLLSPSAKNIYVNSVVDCSDLYGVIDSIVPSKSVVNITSAGSHITGDINYFQNWDSVGGPRIFYWRDTEISGELTTLFNTIAAKGENLTMIILPNTITTLNGVSTTATTQYVRFNGSMTSPTAEETAQGWQIRNS